MCNRLGVMFGIFVVLVLELALALNIALMSEATGKVEVG